MTTTTQIRNWWSPACKSHIQSLTEAYQALDAWFKKFNYAPREGVTGAFNCRSITGGTAYSLHAYDPDGPFVFWSGVKVTKAIAVDINWDKNPYGSVLVTDMPQDMVMAIEGIRTNNGKQLWRWGGRYSGNKDAMHYEIIVSPADLATGIDPNTLPRTIVNEDDDMRTIVRGDATPEWWITDGISKDHIELAEIAAGMVWLGLARWDNATGGPLVVGQGWIDSIPVNERITQTDVNKIADAVVAKLPPANTGGITQAQIKQAVMEGIDSSGLRSLLPGV